MSNHGVSPVDWIWVLSLGKKSLHVSVLDVFVFTWSKK